MLERIWCNHFSNVVQLIAFVSLIVFDISGSFTLCVSAFQVKVVISSRFRIQAFVDTVKMLITSLGFWDTITNPIAGPVFSLHTNGDFLNVGMTEIIHR